MADELSFDTALHLAQGLMTIGERPYWPPGAIESTADDLVRWCTGAMSDGRVWPPEAQARWLVTEARENWSDWHGTAALRALFRSKFCPESRPECQPFESGEKPRIECGDCSDHGITQNAAGLHEYCHCEMGRDMAADATLGATWLECLNRRSMPRRPIRIVRPEDEQPTFDAHIAGLSETLTRARAILANPNATREEKEIAAATLETFEPKQNRKQQKQAHR